uniref:Uncharacterized protein n=1 Tax=Magallana gigas TaxID=29159 RepID=A0A8W8MF10_MAGGI
MTHDNELIYIDRMRTIQKLSGKIKIELPLLRDSFCQPYCVHISPYTENLLVGMSNIESNACLVMRYIERCDILTGSEIPISSCCSETEKGGYYAISHPENTDPENEGVQWMRLHRQIDLSPPKKRKLN